MAFIASVYSSMTKDVSGVQPDMVYNRATGKHQKRATQSGGMTGVMKGVQRKHNPTDAKVREQMRKAGV